MIIDKAMQKYDRDAWMALVLKLEAENMKLREENMRLEQTVKELEQSLLSGPR